MKRFLVSVFALGVMLLGIAASEPAQAAANTPPIDASYNSRIIDDPIFANAHTMDRAAIQNFLNAKLPVCRTGYTCLKSYVDPAVGMNAAQIIDTVAKRYSVNPWVILTTLQKEQSLVTDDYPYPSQYRTAMGYGCPESQSTCDSEYFGLYNQINLGSKLLRVGTDRNCGNLTSYPGWWASPKWALGQNPLVDGRATNIGTCATGALYNYTPHRPDSAWIAYNGVYYYGNYNFIGIFNRWFGSTRGVTYSAKYAGQSQSATSLVPGQTATVTVTFKNSGSATWSRGGANPVRLGTSRPADRASAFATGTGWVGSNRVRLDQEQVAPGQNGSFTFTIKAPGALGTYKEYFRPVADGVGWMQDYGVYLPIIVGLSPGYHATFVSQTVPPEVILGRNGTATVRLQNSGTYTWSREGSTPFRLGTDAPRDRASTSTASGWITPNRIPLQELSVAPGQYGTFRFDLNGSVEGTMLERFKPVVDGVTWLDAPVNVSTEVVGTFAAEYAGQSPGPRLLPGNAATVWIDLRNTGTATWTKAGRFPVRLGTDAPQGRSSKMADGWLTANRVEMQEDTVAPGQVARFQFSVRPLAVGSFREYFRPVADGRTWFGKASHIYLPVESRAINSVQYAGQSAPLTLVPGQIGTAWVDFRNTGTTTWTKGGNNPMRLGTSNPIDRGSIFSYSWLSANRIELQQETVAPGGIGRFSFQVKAPNAPGKHKEYFRPVVEGVSWLEDFGMYLPVTVVNP